MIQTVGANNDLLIISLKSLKVGPLFFSEKFGKFPASFLIITE